MIMQRLREETRLNHVMLEQRVDLRRLGSSEHEYRRLLRRFYGYYQPVETALGELPWLTAGFDFDARRKAPLLRQDLLALGDCSSTLAALPLCRCLPDLSDLARGTGCLYVLEGATLGGQVILRYLQRRAPAVCAKADRFFDGYGADGAQMWQAFGRFASDFCRCHSELEPLIVDAARATFNTIHDWFLIDEECPCPQARQRSAASI